MLSTVLPQALKPEPETATEARMSIALAEPQQCRIPAFPYRPLVSPEIRLLKIKPGGPNDLLECVLDQVPLRGDSKPFYYSLSYVWGDASKTLPILLEGRPFQITTNLYAAMSQLRQIDDKELSYVDTYLWIDAICINQADFEEKSEQIPRLGEIYYESLQVVAWLGNSAFVLRDYSTSVSCFTQIVNKSQILGDYFKAQTSCYPEAHTADISLSLQGIPQHRSKKSKPLPDKAIQQLFQMAEEFWKRWLEAEDDDEDESILKQVFGYHSDLVDAGVLKLLNNPWFARIWTLQEGCLNGNEPRMYMGPYSLELKQLYLFLKTYLHQHPYLALTPGLRRLVGLREIRELSRRREFGLDDLSDREEDPLQDLALCLLKVIHAAGQKESTNPVDQLYGCLGLVKVLTNSKLPQELTPNYHTPFENVYWEYAAFILEHTSDLRVLHTRQRDLGGVPSWVPDFRYLDPKSVGERRSDVSLSSDKRELKLSGIEVGSIRDYIERCGLEEITPTRTNIPRALSRRITDIENRILRPSSTLREIPEGNILENWMKDHHRALQGGIKSFQDTYHRLSAPVYTGRRSKSQVTEPMDSHARNITIAGEFSQTFLLLTDGTIVRVLRTDVQIKAGDLVCVFRGALTPSLVRPIGEAYVFLSQCDIRSGTFFGEDFDVEFWDEIETSEFRLR
ncbi:heterokaryon incompatibility protein-domain-containing protein [Xylariaceae sp. FL0016]|nr:heterokaryon incompatibility protein-domain-containing protein [Xylariaceae sp. FL0016]